MNSRLVITPFVVSLVSAPAAFLLALSLGGPAQPDAVSKTLFAATVFVEILALVQSIRARRLFSPGDAGHMTWTLIVAFLVVRLVAELRRATLLFGIVPQYTEGASWGLFFYEIVLRYLNTLGDLLFIGALVTTLRAYKSTGLKFETLTRDYLYMLPIWAMPVITYIFRDNLGLANAIGVDRYYTTYRLVAVFVAAIILSLVLMVRRYVLQMGGGAVARVWNSVVIAGTARTAAFLALALLSSWWLPGAKFTEQYMYWIFANCWLIAALYQQEVIPDAARPRVVTAAA